MINELGVTLEYYGYAGRILRVDLTKGKVWSEPLDPAMIRDFIGGRGFASKILYDEVDLNADPLAPQNPLIFATGPLTDLAPCSGRMTIAARSPATRIHGDSNVGGGFGIELKRAGFDVVVVKGRAEKPVYLWICDGKAEIRDASHLWGMRVRETTRTLLKEIGDLDAHVACIGPAGENLVYSAAVIVDYNRAAAKTGMGAVMGSKKLKALVARGTLGTKIYNPEKFREAFEDAIRAFADDPGSMLGRTIGSNFLHKVHNKKGALILKNGRLGYLEDIEWVSGETLNKYNLKPTSGCGLCYIACERNLLIKSEKYGDIFYSLEYYSLAAQSYRLGIYNLEDSIYNAKLAEDLGLDHTSPAHLIALAMELYERGIITKDDLDGLDLTWGNVEAVRTILEKMAYREGVGKLFADGYYGLIKRFPEAAKYALHVKGMDNIPQDARAARTYNMRYAISTRGADHMRSSGLSKLAGAIAVDDMAVSEAMKSFLLVENFTTMVNLLEVCT